MAVLCPKIGIFGPKRPKLALRAKYADFGTHRTGSGGTDWRDGRGARCCGVGTDAAAQPLGVGTDAAAQPQISGHDGRAVGATCRLLGGLQIVGR